MTARHTFSMFTEYHDSSNNTEVTHNVETDFLDRLVEEFKYYLWHCGYDYVEDVKVTKVEA